MPRKKDNQAIEANVFFIVYKQGVYGQGVHAISSVRKVAEALAIQSAQKDVDDYHSYDVYRVPLNKLSRPLVDPRMDYGWMNKKPVLRTNRTHQGATHEVCGKSPGKVFIVYKQGMYGHGVHALSLTEEEASKRADELAARDVYNYHSYDVYPVYLDLLQQSSLDPRVDLGWMNGKPLCRSVKKVT